LIPEFNFEGMTFLVIYMIIFAFLAGLSCLYLHEKKKQLKWKKFSYFIQTERRKPKKKDNVIKFRKPED